MKLEGTLGIFSLRELIEMSIYSSVLGVLQLQTSQQVGRIFFRDGEAYHCTYGELVGEDALVALFELQEASFTFEADIVSEEDTLWGDIDSLMSRCEELALRWREVRKQLPPYEHITLQLLRKVENSGFDFEAIHYSIVPAIDGERTLEEIAEYMALDRLSVYEYAVRLQAEGVVALQPGKPKPKQSPIYSPLVETASHSDPLDRIFSSLQSDQTLGVQPASNGHTQAANHLSPEEERILRILRS